MSRILPPDSDSCISKNWKSAVIAAAACCFTVLGSGLIPLQAQADDPPTIKRGYAVEGTHGAVASGGSTATNVGLDILLAGGNAFDAAAATILALTETDDGNVHFGGEVPVIFYDADAAEKKVRVLSGQGVAPALATLAYFQGIGGIPGANGGIKNAAVPALPLAVMTLVKDHGTMTFEQIASPARALFAEHTGWKAYMANTLGRMIQADVDARAAGGDRVAGLQAARDIFYKGAIADEMVDWITDKGGLIRKSDLEAFAEPWSRYEDPVGIDYKGYTVYKADTWTQGPYLLETLEILEDMNVAAYGHNSANYTHVLIEALKLGLADRDAYFGDPLFVDVPLAGLISEDYADVRRTLIDMGSASREIRPGDPEDLAPLALGAPYPEGLQGPVNDTSTCITADRWGNVVVATPSGWGGTRIGNNTGVYINSRLISFNTWTGHPNAIAPGKRPRITLTPTLALKDGLPEIGISVAGGDAQDQAALQVFLNLVEFGFTPGNSVKTSAYPRFGTDHLTGSFSQPSPQLGSLKLNSSVPSSVRTALQNRGHSISSTGAYGSTSVMVLDNDTGLIHAAGDQSAGRYAAAFSLPIVNNPPTANPQSVALAEDGPPLDILLRGADPDGDPLTFSIASGPLHGSLSGTAPNLTYTPDPDYFGPDSFTFVVNDGRVNSVPATVNITVENVNDPPVAFDQVVTVVPGASVQFTLQVTDADGDPLTYTVYAANTDFGVVTGEPPTLTYTAGNVEGTDVILFSVEDAESSSDLAEVSIIVAEPNDPPVAQSATVTTLVDTAVAFTLVGSDPNGDEIFYEILSFPSHGRLTGLEPNLTYTPFPGYTGSDSFRFRVFDGRLYSEPATIEIVVGAVTYTPLLSASFDTGAEGFVYRDDSFRGTSQPNYASGAWGSAYGASASGGGLRVLLGGRDNNTISGMSGGWRTDFTLDQPKQVRVSVGVNLIQSSEYESDEYSEALVSINGVLVGQGGADYLARVVGNGNGGSAISTGWQTYELDLGTLAAGTHRLIIGGYNNKKTYSNESTEVLVDDVVISVR